MKYFGKYSICFLLAMIIAYQAIMAATAVAAPSTKEKKLLRLVNDVRADAGLRHLKWGKRLAVAAKRHSRDMIDRGYFAHVTPEGTNLLDRLYVSRVKSWTFAGENLAGAATPRTALNLWMESPTHRAIILDPSFKRTGIGIIKGGPYKLMITMDVAD